MNNLRRVIQQRNDLSDDDSAQIERVLRDYSEGRLDDRETAHQLRGYVPNSEGLGMDDLLPLVTMLLQGRGGSGDIGDLIGGLLGGRPANTGYPTHQGRDLGDLLGDLLGQGQSQTRSPQQYPSSGDVDLRGLIGSLLGGGQPDIRQQPQNTGGGVLDILDDVLGGGQPDTRQQPQTNDGGVLDMLENLLGGSTSQPNADERPTAKEPRKPGRDHNLRKKR